MEHWADARPAWLWSADGAELLWRNGAARFFLAKLKKNGPKLLADPEPIRGQVARLVRLGTQGRSSLSRIQFLAGDKPISATCTVTPLMLPGGSAALLIVAVDPIGEEFLAEAVPDALTLSVLPDDAQYLVTAADGQVASASALAQSLGDDVQAVLGDGSISLDGRRYDATRLSAGPNGESVIILEAAEPEAQSDPAAEPDLPPEPVAPVSSDLAAWADADSLQEMPTTTVDTAVDPQWAEVEAAARATLEAEEEPLPADDIAAEPPESDEPQEPRPASEGSRLSGLFERLANDAQLYAPLTPEEDIASPPDEQETQSPALVKIVGRGFQPLDKAPADEAPAEPAAFVEPDAVAPEIIEPVEVEPAPEEPVSPPAAAEEPAPPADAETVERVSRYNFDELSRILNDRVSGDMGAQQSRQTTIEEIIANDGPPAGVPSSTPAAATGSLVNLGGETLVLNRLPLGILVFRDQQVLFANRAITEMIGYESVESLRSAGLASIFPAASDEQPEAGPVNHLMQRDGTLVPVTARLQSISWQGRPALMLSASATEVRTGHEGAVRAFAEMLATTREDGFIEANRAGVISEASPLARQTLRQGDEPIVGKPLSSIVDRQDQGALRAFLERPARFAETTRPVLTAAGHDPDVEIMLFAQGQAGIVTGYFGFVRRRAGAPALPAPQPGGADPALLGRLSRGLRRPLNTIIGFSDLIGSAAFGELGNPRYKEYALDIRTAGQEITALVDELDDFTRLRDGRYAPRPSDVDLAALLESCAIRVRGQANAARVLVRSAISERLPRIRADRASLGQAVLNLLASAIDQTPVGGAVVLSAKLEEDGSISVHVRDSADRMIDRSESFVVFRDGVGKDGELLTPVRSTVGLALTRSLLAVNACSLSVDPAGSVGTIFSLVIPRELVTKGALPAPETPPVP